MYREHRPNILLIDFVETYWTAEGFIPGEQTASVLPDGCVDILFVFDENGLSSFRSFIVGTMTSSLEVLYKGKFRMLGIRFRPGGITAFTRASINEFTDKRIDISLIETLFNHRFYEELPGKGSLPEMIVRIDSYLIRKLSSAFELDRRIIYAADLIRRNHGLISPNDVAEQACLSVRQLERKFKSIVGISPKMFGRIMKFRNAVDYLKNNSTESLFSVAVDCGYYDHAHLIKDFKCYSGDSPSGFRH